MEERTSVLLTLHEIGRDMRKKSILDFNFEFFVSYVNDLVSAWNCP